MRCVVLKGYKKQRLREVDLSDIVMPMRHATGQRARVFCFIRQFHGDHVPMD